MATVKINQGAARSPSQDIIEEANKIVRVKDATGRQIGVRRIGSSLRRRVWKALSAESAEKRQYIGMVFVAASCCELDGEPIALPSSELQFDALIDRLDDAGLLAIEAAIKANFKYETDSDSVGE